MPTFQKVKLGDVVEILSGGTPDSSNIEYWKNGDICWATLLDCHKKYLFDTQRKITKIGLKNSSAKLLPVNTIIFSSRATIGEICITKVETTTNQGSKNFICNPEVLYFEYLYYYLKYKAKSIEQSAGGTTYKEINKAELSNLEICLPDIKTQTRITSVLSAYDDLIENNEKRIKALEQMAQLLYTEWFVKFKFPGCEKKKTKSRSERSSATGMIDSGTEYGMIPQGWEVKKFGDSFDVKYGKNLPTTKISETGKYAVYGAGGIIGYYDQKNIDAKTALITCRGNGSGTVWRTFSEGFITNNSFTVSSKNKEVAFEFIYSCLKGCNISASISGSAQPQITIESINFVKFVLPPIKLIKSFVEKARKLYELSDKLRQRNETLSKTRDLLIPQLVTVKREMK